MGLVVVLARHGVRQDRWAILAIAVSLAAGLGAGFTSLEIAERTERAYPRYREDADVAQLVVNPSLTTDETADLLRSIDGVESVTSDALLTALPDVRAVGGSLGDVSNLLQVRVSSEGRYVTQDRPVVHEGRMIRDGREAFISADTAASLGLAVGDEVPLLVFWAGAEFTTDVDELVSRALESVDVTIVGVGSFADEVIPDDLIPRQKILVTPDVGARFDCVFPQPAPDDPRSIDELYAAFFPPACSATYHYFSLRTTGGDAGAVAVGERIAAALEEANASLPAAMRENDVGYFFIPSFTADEAKRLDESLSPIVISLRAFAVAAILVPVVLALMLAGRQARRRRPEVAVWLALGITRRTRALALAVPPLLATSAGLVVALLAAWLTSRVGAIGSASAVDVDATRSLGGHVAVAATATLVAVSGLVVVVVARMASPARASSVGARPMRARGNQPALTLGVRAAGRGVGALAVLAGASLAVLTVTATLVFSASLLRFIDEPDRYGWPYDVAALVNAGYDNPNLDAVRSTLDDPRSGVARWGHAALSLGARVDGTAVPVVAMRDGFDAMPGPVVQGRLPRGDDEVALGQLTANELGVGVGDEVTISVQYGERVGTVTGFVVLPAVGAVESDRASLGTGVLLPPPFVDEIVGGAADQLGLSGPEIADSLGSFIVIDLEPGVDPAAWVDEHEAAMVAWDPFGVPPLTYSEPVRPPVVVDVEASQRIPELLDGVLALAMGVSVVAGVASGTNGRRRELAIFRALGGSAGQVRSSVRAHALAVVGTGLLVGLPLGVALGRTAYSAFAESLGAPPDPLVPAGWLAVLTASVLVLGFAAAIVPARRATSRGTLAHALRTDASPAAG
jgi:hypothetical protein